MNLIMSSPAPVPATATETALTAVHPDITRTHILTRLDGPALAALACASPQLSTLTSDEDLWKAVTTATWPSTSDIRVRNAVSSFPSGHRSLFSDSFPLLHAPDTTTSGATSSAELISAVDLYYKNDPIFSTVHVTETESDLFRCSPFRVELVDKKESIPTRITNPTDTWRTHLEENLTLSWIVVDPARNKAANLSTRDPVAVQWVNGDLLVRYSTVLGRSTAADIVQIGAVVNLGGGKVGGAQVHVTEVSMHVEDAEARRLSGEESLSILLAAMDGGERKKWERGRGKAMFEEYEVVRRERKWKQEWREKALDLVCIAVGVPFLVTFWIDAIFGG